MWWSHEVEITFGDLFPHTNCAEVTQMSKQQDGISDVGGVGNVEVLLARSYCHNFHDVKLGATSCYCGSKKITHEPAVRQNCVVPSVAICTKHPNLQSLG